MNLPSLSRSASATGVILLLFTLSGYSAPVLEIHLSKQRIVPTVSGASAHIDNHVYYAGGTTSTGTVTNAVTVVDTFHRTVSALASMPTARAGLALVSIFYNQFGTIDALLAIGGTNGSTAVGNVELYNLATGTWSELASMPTPRAYLSAVWGTDHKVYAIGGVNSSGQTVNTVEVYDPAKNTWAEGPSLVTPRSHLAATLTFPDVIYVAGGQDATGKVLNTTEGLFLGATVPAWVTGFSMNTPREDFGISLGSDGFMHALGGKTTGGTPVSSIEGYRFSTNTWTTEANSLPYPLSGLTATQVLNGAIFVLGGEDGTRLKPQITWGIPPAAASHTVTYFIHTDDQPYNLGTQEMDQIPPLNSVGLLSLGLLSTTTFTSFPGVEGTIEPGGSLTVTVPGLIIVGAVNTITVTAVNQDGSDPVVIGSVNSLLGLSGTVTVPITPPVALKKKALVLSLSTLLGVDLDLSGGLVTVQISGLDGRPSDPQ